MSMPPLCDNDIKRHRYHVSGRPIWKVTLRETYMTAIVWRNLASVFRRSCFEFRYDDVATYARQTRPHPEITIAHS